jgi:hypothetical protein
MQCRGKSYMLERAGPIMCMCISLVCQLSPHQATVPANCGSCKGMQASSTSKQERAFPTKRCYCARPHMAPISSQTVLEEKEQANQQHVRGGLRRLEKRTKHPLLWLGSTRGTTSQP